MTIDGKWTASDYLDNGRFGIITDDNTIVVGISVGLTEEQCRRIVQYHNERLEGKP